MSRRKIYEGLPLPAFLLPKGLDGIVLDVARRLEESSAAFAR